MRQHGYIYRVTNRINGRIYVGQRRGEFRRNYYGSGYQITRAVKKHGLENFQLEFLRSAESQEHLDVLEKHFISETRKKVGMDGCYNIRDGGLGSSFRDGKWRSTGIKWTDEKRRQRAREKFLGDNNPMRKRDNHGPNNFHWGKKHSEEAKKKIADKTRMRTGALHWAFGKTRSPEHCAAISRAKTGKTHKSNAGFKMSEETKAKMSASHKGLMLGRKFSEETKLKMKASALARWAKIKQEVSP